MSEEKLRPVMVYLSQEEFDQLEREAREEGRSGVSAQVRYILAGRRKAA